MWQQLRFFQKGYFECSINQGKLIFNLQVAWRLSQRILLNEEEHKNK